MHESGMRPIHPGEVLLEEYLQPLKITPAVFAGAIEVPVAMISELIQQRRSLTPALASRIAVALKTTDQFWMNLQARYDVRK